jgi:hypothetical protein
MAKKKLLPNVYVERFGGTTVVPRLCLRLEASRLNLLARKQNWNNLLKCLGLASPQPHVAQSVLNQCHS